MNTKLYVGNLSFEMTENDLQDLFQAHGPVTEVNLIVDRTNGRSRGFGFVTMATPEAAQTAIQALNGQTVDNRALTVTEARPREERSDRPYEGGRGGGGAGKGGDRGSRRQGNRY